MGWIQKKTKSLFSKTVLAALTVSLTVLILVAVLGIVILRIHATSSKFGLRKPAAIACHAGKKICFGFKKHFLLR